MDPGRHPEQGCPLLAAVGVSFFPPSPHARSFWGGLFAPELSAQREDGLPGVAESLGSCGFIL